MVHDRTRVVQRIRSLFLEVGVRIPRGKNTRRNVSLRMLRDAAVRQIARAYLRQLDMAADLVATARRDLVTEAQRSSVFELLQSIPYIGEIRAAELTAVVGDPERFHSIRRFWAYGGLGVVRRASAEHRVQNGVLIREQHARGFRLSRNYQPRLKKVLKDIALHASLCSGAFRVVYDYHLKRGKQPSIARVALARKIAAVILAVWRNGVPFKPSMVRRRKLKSTSGRASKR